MNWKIVLILIVVFFVAFVGGFLLYKNIFKTANKIVKPNETANTNLTDDELKKEIGQMLMIGFRGIEASENSDIQKVIKDVKVGGVVLFDFDVPSNNYPRNIISPEQTKKLISDIQEYSEIPLFTAIDAEGGNINRLKSQYGFLPILSPEKMGADKTLQTTEKQSIELAQELSSLGFNMNLAPVVDVNLNKKNPIIGALGRSFSSDSEEVVKNAEVFIQNHLNDNVIPVEKHFPGQGSATQDSHLGVVDITNVYKQEELIPYQELNNEGLLDAVMVGHVINKNIDKNYPASMSSAFIGGILRKQIGFTGVVISDDMQMDAITKNYDFADAIIRFINAGGDVVSILNNSPSGYDGQLAYKVRDIIFNAVKDKKIDEKIITESYSRIISLKKKFRIISPTSEEIKSEKFNLLSSTSQLNFGNALDIANYVSQKVDIRPAFLLAILQEELTLEKTDLCYLTDLKTGVGVRVTDGKVLQRTMSPERDIPGFLEITKELGKDPLKTLITCPMSFGWGGAMGPADFIPSTWLKYKDEIEKITGKPADPWNTRDAFLAAGMYLSESGAAQKNHNGEWDSAMIYFSGSANSPYTWYADGACEIADKFQKDINIIK